jgi:hypothetical protein
LCHLFVSTTVFGGDDDNSTDTEVENHHCKLDTDEEEWKFRTVALPAGFIETHQSSFSKNPILNISNVVVTNDTVELSGTSEVSLHHETSPHRRLAPKTGSPTVLSVYITSVYGHRPDSTVDDIKNGIFGTGTNNAPYNTFKQYSDCSFGALSMKPAEGMNIDGGVVTVQVNRPLDSTCDLDNGTCAQDINNAAAATLGRALSDFDMVMMCLPTGVANGGRTDWAAYAFTGYRTAHFTNGYCSIMTTVGHELGHLMGYGQ